MALKFKLDYLIIILWNYLWNWKTKSEFRMMKSQHNS